MAAIEIPGGHGLALPLRAGQAVRVVNTHGTQVVDTWALALGDTSEYLSVEHTRRMQFSLFPKRGEAFYSNRRTKMLLLEEDSFPGQHDTLFACCDKWLYKNYNCAPGHRSCRDNFLQAVFTAGFDATSVPNPVNLWMHIPVHDSERISIETPLSRPGDHVLLRALIDTLVVFSACPMDVVPINGPDLAPKPVHVEVVG